MNHSILARAAAAILCAAPIPLAAQAIRYASTAPSVPAVDAPELAHLGSFAIGTRVIRVVLPDTPTLIGPGTWIAAPRTVSVRLWYPARVGSAGVPVRYAHSVNARGSRPVTLVTPGIAIGEAPPHANRFPLVLISHGFRGWGEAMSYVGENLASKGYVVAAIDHRDPSNNDPGALALSFGNVLLQRASDQSGVVASLLKRTDGVASMIDGGRVGLIGYSMGGFGALATAGAAYDPASPTFRQLPAGARANLFTGGSKDVASKVGALVTIAPWGGQPTARVWTAASLAKIKAPVLIVAGEDDDVVDTRAGVRWIHDALTGSDRRMLTYQAARHNIGNNAAPAGLPDFGAVESQVEPVWRGDRLNAINVHFITAFLDLNLKGDRTRAAYLDVPTTRAVDGVWPEPVGAAGSGAIAGDTQATHWRGFQRRWAIGLSLTHAPALGGESDKPKAEQHQRQQR